MTERISVDAIRNCLEGAIPAYIATCAADGTPNVTPLSQVHYVDGAHVALSYQFFNKTRENILATQRAAVQVIDPLTGAVYRLSLHYLRTESDGPLFESMKAKLAGIASHTGMQGVFRLLGADIYRVLDIELVPSGRLPPPPPRSLLSALRRCAQRLSSGTDLSELFDQLLADLQVFFGIEHAMILMLDERGQRLYTVASRGYAASGVGSEIPLGQGVIGVAAGVRTAIRISHMTSEYAYSRAIREVAEQLGMAGGLETEIPLPGLPTPHSQLAVPIVAGPQLLGVLFVESMEDGRFGYDDEDALAVIAAQLGIAIQAIQLAAQAAEGSPSARDGGAAPDGPAAVIRYYPVDQSVFVDQDYLIKGVAGSIFWKLMRDHVESGRTEFMNREIRLDPTIRLPELSENLEARLILLQRRLAERCTFLCIEKTGRGRFRLQVRRPLKLVEMSGAAG